MHCLAAEAEYCCGRIQRCDYHLQQVVSHANGLKDVVRARKIQVYALGAQGRVDDAIDVAFDTVRELGVKLPKNQECQTVAHHQAHDAGQD